MIAATAGHLIDPTTNFATSGRPVRGIAVPDGDLLDRLLAFNKQVLSLMPPHSGATHLETFKTVNGELLFNEIAARPGGVGIVPNFAHRSGYDLYEVAIRAQLGEDPPEVIHLSPELTGLLLVYAGPVQLLKPPQVPERPWITFVDLFNPPGGVLDKPGDISQAILNVGVSGKTTDEVLDRLDELRAVAESTMRVMPLHADEQP